METELKKQILAFVKDHNDGSEETAVLISAIEAECTRADVDSFAVSVSDLEDYDGPALREHLGKGPDDEYTMDDCECIAGELAEFISDEFGEDLDFIINN